MKGKIILMTYCKGKIETVRKSGDYRVYTDVTQSTIIRFEEMQESSEKVTFDFPYKSTTPLIAMYFQGSKQ